MNWNWRTWTPAHWLIATGATLLAGMGGYEVWKHYAKPPTKSSDMKSSDGSKTSTPGSGLTVAPEVLCSALYASLPKDTRASSDGTRLPSLNELVQLAISNSEKTNDPFSLNNAADVIDASIRDLGLDPKFVKASKCLRDKATAMPAAPVGLGSLLFPTDKTAGASAGILARRRRG